MELGKLVYDLVKKFPTNERFNLVDQMRRAVVSISSNIAEGSRKMSRAEKRHYYTIACASASELETQLKLAKTVSLASHDSFLKAEDVVDHTLRLLNGLVGKFRD